jgi:tetratricopeptide (TPR) repeat protein
MTREDTRQDFGDELAELLEAGRLDELIARAREIVEQSRAQFGEVHERTAKAISDLAFSYREMGDYDTAAAHWNEACAIFLALFGERSPQYVQSLFDVANAELLGGRIDEAEGLVDRATTIVQSIPGDQRDTLLLIWLLTARLKLRRQDTEAAEAFLLDAMRLRLRQLEGEYGGSYNWEDQRLSDIFGYLSWVYDSQGNFRAAKGAMQKSIRIRDRRFDKMRPFLARKLSQLGEIQRKLGDLSSAKESQLAALEILKKMRPAGHIDIVNVERRLAKLDGIESEENKMQTTSPGGS